MWYIHCQRSTDNEKKNTKYKYIYIYHKIINNKMLITFHETSPL